MDPVYCHDTERRGLCGVRHERKRHHPDARQRPAAARLPRTADPTARRPHRIKRRRLVRERLAARPRRHPARGPAGRAAAHDRGRGPAHIRRPRRRRQGCAGLLQRIAGAIRSSYSCPAPPRPRRPRRRQAGPVATALRRTDAPSGSHAARRGRAPREPDHAPPTAGRGKRERGRCPYRHSIRGPLAGGRIH